VKKVVVIGGGIAGLGAVVYVRKYGGYLFEGGLHWLAVLAKTNP